jgi:hypothetical protein
VIRPGLTFAQKPPLYVELGFDAVQFHDDDAVPELNDLAPRQIRERAGAVRRQLEDQGLVAEFVAPRLWEHPMTIDGAYTSNSQSPDGQNVMRDRSTCPTGLTQHSRGRLSDSQPAPKAPRVASSPGWSTREGYL